jgi:hypothetical protein
LPKKVLFVNQSARVLKLLKMTLKIFNTKSRRKEIFKPIQKNVAKIYSCGPTVYARAHVGNLRAILFADTLQRVLRFVENLQIFWVLNITDVDDKTIRDSQKKFPVENPKIALKKFCEFWEMKFFEDLKKLNFDEKHFFKNPRATDFIAEMQTLIREIYENGFAKIVDGSIFFDVEKFSKSEKYGVLLNLNLQNLRGDRVLADETTKENLADFALWKAAKDGEPAWDFPFDRSSEILISITKNADEIEIIKKVRWEKLLRPFDFPESQKEFRAGEKNFIVAKNADEIIGFASFGFDEKNNAVRMRSFFIEEKWRGRGDPQSAKFDFLNLRFFPFSTFPFYEFFQIHRPVQIPFFDKNQPPLFRRKRTFFAF